jgi:predicted DNA-binding transcriptional regulator AlpA
MTDPAAEPERRLISRKDVERKTGLKGGSLFRAIERGKLPEALVVGPGTLRWWSCPQAWCRRSAGRSDRHESGGGWPDDGHRGDFR